VDEQIQVDLLLESDDLLDLSLHSLLVVLNGELSLVEPVSGDSNLLGLLEKRKEEDGEEVRTSSRRKRREKEGRTGKDPMVVVGNRGSLSLRA